MKPAHEKYIPFVPLKMARRAWPDRELKAPPVWCSVDLRDGNQALIDPMNVREKLELFHTLVDIGVKEIEVGFPSASETEYEFIRTLIEGGHIPDDVTTQVLVQAREHLIRRTFEAIDGAKHVIFHFYNSTSTLQRKVVFHMDMEGITKIATDAADLIYEMSQPMIEEGMNLRFEYSPESFMGTEMDYAVEICQAVLEHLHADPEHKVILNLPTTVENCMPNYFADEIEYFISRLPGRDRAIISLHPHNDRGCGVATAEMGLLAGAERVEATLFGNGERTGNVDAVTLAMNMYSHGVDPKLDFSDMPDICATYERVTRMHIYERTPYAGQLVFAAFSGSHQDAIAKGMAFRKERGEHRWTCPYIPVDPHDIGRTYDADVIRINSQSGKGGIGFLLQQNYGYNPPPHMREQLGYRVKEVSDHDHRELSVQEVLEVFEDNYVNNAAPLNVTAAHYTQNQDGSISANLTLRRGSRMIQCGAAGNGRLDAVANAIEQAAGMDFTLIHYSEHALDNDTDSRACCYVGLKWASGKETWGCGTHTDIIVAGIRALVSAINNQ